MKLFAYAVLFFIGMAILPHAAAAQYTPPVQPLENYENDILNSGGILLEEQAAYNVTFYDLDLFVDPSDSSIHGSAIAHVKVIKPLDTFVAHLDTVFLTERVISIVSGSGHKSLDFSHKDGLIIATLPETAAPGQSLVIEIAYHGQPRPAPNPPWEGGFTWETTPSGDPWIGVSCQVNGADIWWPVKDHPSDRPDSVSMKITVPADVKAISNGLLRSEKQLSEDTRTFHWVTNYPINNYAVSVNIGPYEKIHHEFSSTSGESFPIYFWMLPENRSSAEILMEQVVDHMRFFEKLLGPYPFRREKYGIVEAPFLGMEHQTLIAYGAGFKNDVIFETESGFDDLHHHELAHEWWGNFVTASDWKDFWIHEGFGTYMQPLYAEYLHGAEKYRHFMKMLYDRIENNLPIAPEASRTTMEMFDGRDIYMKGAWVLHTLRYLIGDELFFESLKCMTYPDCDSEAGSQITPGRFVDTREYITLVEALTNRELGWFFNAYLLNAELPELIKRWDEDLLTLEWSVPGGEPFPMPVEVFNGEKMKTVIPNGQRTVKIVDPEKFEIDPDAYILRNGMFE